ncbi:unnamed protein product [Bursaphelenchus okinawaensis]|uniref:Major facilitator superfamily (MFS) profile domain-containing protein n=1 Tax=Bursaphelenchus okinawaensis TaxID=465554 RepID=A0A811L244_9BILA|nr:unnamed protein product [Bursaphelenchus okinawaensis]CAG9114836.1 unnamed protein product [Bursaphelenchus okinawaensis]
MVIFNFSVLCMAPQMGSNNTGPVHTYSPLDQTYLMYAIGFGSLLGTFPFTYSFSRFGTRYIFTAAGFLSVISTALIPMASSYGLNAFLVVRFLQGVSYSADFAAIGMLTSIWASLKQHALFLSLLTCYSPLSSTLTNAVSGYLCESSLGWPSIYYFHSAVGAILFTYWFVTYTDHPATSNWVSPIELEKIERNKAKEELEFSGNMPYWQICKNPVVLTVWFNAFIEISSGIFLLIYTPIYLNKVHGFGLVETGLLSSLPPLVAIPLRILFGVISDKIKFWSERTKMNVFNTFSAFGPAVFYLAVVLVRSSTAAICMLFSIHIFYAGSGGGFYKCATLSCRQFSPFVIANIQFIKCLTLFFAPSLYGFFVKDESSSEQWNHIFITMSITLAIATVSFLFFSTDTPQPFTHVKKDNVDVDLSTISEDLSLKNNNGVDVGLRH